MKKNKIQTIQKSINHGNRRILRGEIITVVFFTLCLLFISYSIKSGMIHYSEVLMTTADTITESEKVYRDISMSVYEDTGNASLEMPTYNKLCALVENDPGKIVTERAAAKEIYERFISAANKAIQLKSTDRAGAIQIVENELADVLDEFTDCMHDITTSYNKMVNQSIGLIDAFNWVGIVIGIILLGVTLIIAYRVSKKMAKEIAIPVVTVSEWADELSKGADHIEAMESMPKIEMEEIQRMVKAFETMSESIKGNVDVVRKVADGDMTAYVNIRSSQDSLGKSLYKMVQSNDLMFAQISQIADSVTEGTDSIAAAAKLLADSCTNQANAIAEFQKDINNTNQLVKENAEDAAHAHALSDTIQREVVVSKEKMQELVEAMKAIYKASEKVSGVIANIESLANQTNLLAINATIEAKRAGEAGKSFAVVASSVKDLADKSAISATQTKALIDDTIAKAKRGSQLSDETYSTFEMIMDSLEQIIAVSSKIAETGAQQHKNMVDIAVQIDEISRDVSTNAATSEETAAMTVEISKNAEVLKASMGQFNLRNRQPGKPYIPPEKSNDKEFIRVATENYNKFINSAAGKKLAQEMNLTAL